MRTLKNTAKHMKVLQLCFLGSCLTLAACHGYNAQLTHTGPCTYQQVGPTHQLSLDELRCLFQEFQAGRNHVEARVGPSQLPILHYATQLGQIGIIAYLLQQGGANPNSTDSRNSTALHEAAKQFPGIPEMVDVLLGHPGTDVNIRENHNGQTALHTAVVCNHSEVVMRLLDDRRTKLGLLDHNNRTAWQCITSFTSRDIIEAFSRAHEKQKRTISCHLAQQLEEDRPTALHYQAEKGSLQDFINVLWGLPHEVNIRNEKGHTALCIAVSAGSLEKVDALLGCRFTNPNVATDSGRTVLHDAVSNNLVEMVQRLLNHPGTDPNVQERLTGQTPLFMAVALGNENMVKLLLNHSGTRLGLQDYNGRTVLHTAVIYNRPIIFDQLAYYKQNLTIQDKTCCTPWNYVTPSTHQHIRCALLVEVKTSLHQLVKEGSLSQLEEALWHPSNNELLNIHDPNGHTPLYLAVKSKDPDKVAELLSHPCTNPNVASLKGGQTALHAAVLNNLESIVEQLLKHPCIDPNIKDRVANGRTALYVAVCQGNQRIVHLLLQHYRINVNIGFVLEAAIMHGHSRIADLLQAHPSIKDTPEPMEQRAIVLLPISVVEGSFTPFSVAKEAGEEKEQFMYIDRRHVVKELKDALAATGIDVTTRDAEGRTALGIVEGRCLAKIRTLLSNPNINLNARNEAGLTLLHVVVKQGLLTVLQVLLEDSRTNLNIQDNSNRTALHYAIGSYNVKTTVEALIDAGIALNTKDSQGQTALDYAATKGLSNLIMALIQDKRS